MVAAVLDMHKQDKHIRTYFQHVSCMDLVEEPLERPTLHNKMLTTVA